MWVFRGRKMADRAIQVTTNSPVNYVGMSVVIEDLPPLMWHAELGRSLPGQWSGRHQRGVELHDLRAAVIVWATRYGQRAWLRQLQHPVTREMEDGVLRRPPGRYAVPRHLPAGAEPEAGRTRRRPGDRVLC